MSSSSQYALLRERRFLPLFLTQTLGALNDNIFKQALIILVTFVSTTVTQEQGQVLVQVAAALFILPFFLFSATAGQLADKLDKAAMTRWVKVLELAIMLIGGVGFVTGNITLLILMLFLMGTQSTLFGPIKFGVLPQYLDDRELVGGNGLIEMATFLAILIGTMIGGSLIEWPGVGVWAVFAVVVAVALAGMISAWNMPKAPAADPLLRIDYNPISATWNIVRELTRHRTVFLSCLGVSWFWFYGSIYFTQLPYFTKEVLGGGSGVLTLLLTVFSIGTGVGSLLCERMSGHRVEIGLVPFGSIGMTVFGIDLFFATPLVPLGNEITVAAFLQAPGTWRLLFDLFGMAVFGGFFIVPLFAMIQQQSAAAIRSRIIAANNILNAAFMVAAALFSIALTSFAEVSIPQLLLIVAVLNALVAIYIYSLVPEFLLRFLSWLLINALYRVRPKGLDQIPEEGPVLLVCNHISYVDALIVGGCIRRPVRFVMYYKIFQLPVLSFLFRTARAIPIAGYKEDPKLMEEAFEQVSLELRAGNVVCIFPEGSLTADGNIAGFRPGVEKILERDPVPVVPLALTGLWGSLFSRFHRTGGRMWPRKLWSPIGLVAGPSMPPEQANAEVLEAKVRELRGDLA
ncbi:MAG: MFS transporter [Xanthomonadales bacterium]|nr:MFS transporter [Xanthomonadales bacterium]